jgi:aromatic-L-amino-acid/L-tryptophan decarboxylase
MPPCRLVRVGAIRGSWHPRPMTHHAPHRTDLDPANWQEARALAHRALDDMFGWLETARDRPVWEQMPAAKRAEMRLALPPKGVALEEIYQDFQRLVLPYGAGNEHPRFFGWVNGGGTAAGILAELLVAIFNPNCGGRDHAAIEVERQVIAWAAEAIGFPAEAGGVLMTGSSMANMVALLVARRATLGEEVRARGIEGTGLRAYCSVAAHGCIPRAMDMAGLGTNALRLIPVGPDHRMNIAALAEAVAADRAAGLRPFLVVGTAGTVDTAAFDDLPAARAVAKSTGAWFHVDGAFGATAAFSTQYRPLLNGIELADSIAFDFHKWAQVPYDAGCVLVRDRTHQLETFAQNLAYLEGHERGIAGNSPWPRDLGPDLSREFRALKVWFTLRAYGALGIGQVVDNCCAVAQHLAARVRLEPTLEMLAPVALNIVCFRVAQGSADLNQLNKELVADLQESGIAAPSTTTIDGKLAIRAGVFNHRSTPADVDALVDGVLEMARRRIG